MDYTLTLTTDELNTLVSALYVTEDWKLGIWSDERIDEVRTLRLKLEAKR